MNKDIRSEKGLSMILVIVVLAVIIIAIIETVVIVRKWVKQEELDDLTTVMLLIQARTKTYSDKEAIEENADEDDKAELKGTPIDEIEDNSKINELVEKEIIDKDDKYYLLSKQDLEELHVYDIKDSDEFLVSYDTEEVVYLNGIEKDGKTLYKLSDIKDSEEEQNSENDNDNEDTEENEESEDNNEDKEDE